MTIWYEWVQDYPHFFPGGIPPVANFSTYPVAGPVLLDVSFYDQSSQDPTGWYWDFGDGYFSSLRNPIHTYSLVGKHTITLTVSNFWGSNSTTKEYYINALPDLGQDPSGCVYDEYYLYSEKAWEIAPSGVSSHVFEHAMMQNAPVVVTPSGYEVTNPEQPWAKTNGPEKYKKVGFGYFELDENGQYDPDAREFSLVPDSKGKIVFNGILKEDVFIEYEAGPSGYYIMDTVDYNPVRDEVAGGFVHFSQTTAPTTLFLNVSQESVRGDGYQGVRLTASIYDTDFDRVPDKNIVFELQNLTDATVPSGYYPGRFCRTGHLIPNEGSEYSIDASGHCISVLEKANRRGEAFASYLTENEMTGIVSVKAYVLDASGVYDDAQFYQYWMSVGPFILDLSLLDTLNYLVYEETCD
jgi:PKD repeat protein